MYKFMLSLGLLVSLIFSGPTWAQTNDRPRYIKALPGTTVQMIAKDYRISVDQLLRLNHPVKVRPGHTLLPWEELNVNPATNPKWMGMTTWQFVGADVYGPSLVPLYEAGLDDSLHSELRSTALGVVDLLLPQAVAEYMRTQIEIQDPKIVQIYSDLDSILVLDNLIFGGYQVRKDGTGKSVRSKVKVWRDGVVCLWKKVGKSDRISTQHVAVWDPIQVPGINKKYQLMVFLECRNGATTSQEVEPEPIVQEAPTPEPAPVVEEIPPPPVVQSEPAPEPLYAWQQRCSHTLTGEGVHLDEGPSEYEQRTANWFYNHIHDWWGCQRLGSPKMDRFGFRLYTEAAGYGVDNHANTLTGNVRGGPLLVPFYGRGWWMEIDGGPGWEATERDYWTASPMSDGRIRLSQKKRWTDGPLGYGRFQVFGPFRSGLNLQYREGRLMEERFGQLTVRPGRFYLQATYQKQNRHEVHRHVEGTTLVFPADVTVLEGARLGYRVTDNLTAFASMNKYWYWSEIFQYDHRGPGAGVEWYFTGTSMWKFDLHIMRLNNHDNAYLPIVENGIRISTNAIDTENNEWRVLASFGYNSGRRQYHIHQHSR